MFLDMPKNGFPIPTAKNRFQITNLHPKENIYINIYIPVYIFQKVKYHFFNANLLEKFQKRI